MTASSGAAGVRARRCRSTSEFGDCYRWAKHRGIHGVPIGDDFWFGYERLPGQQPTPHGYGHFHGDSFCAVQHCDREDR